MEQPAVSQQATLRRLSDALVVLGSGIIVFGAWTVLKTIASLLLQTSEAREITAAADSDLKYVVSIVLLFLFLGFDLAMRLYVGLSARAEGLGKRKRHAYLFPAALMALGSFFTVAIVVTGVALWGLPLSEAIVTLCIEGTAFAVLALLIYSAIKLKRLKKSME